MFLEFRVRCSGSRVWVFGALRLSFLVRGSWFPGFSFSRSGFSVIRVRGSLFQCLGFLVRGFQGFAFGVVVSMFGVSSSGFSGFLVGWSGCRLRGSGFSKFRIWCSGSRVRSFGFGVSGSGFRGSGFWVRLSGVWVSHSGSGFYSSGFRVRGFWGFAIRGFRGSSFWFPGFGIPVRGSRFQRSQTPRPKPQPRTWKPKPGNTELVTQNNETVNPEPRNTKPENPEAQTQEREAPKPRTRNPETRKPRTQT